MLVLLLCVAVAGLLVVRMMGIPIALLIPIRGLVKLLLSVCLLLAAVLLLVLRAAPLNICGVMRHRI